MTVAPPRSRTAPRVSAITVSSAVALLLGVAAMLVGLTTPAGLLLAASAVTLDVLILQLLAPRRFVFVGTALGMVLLVGLLVLATSFVGGV